MEAANHISMSVPYAAMLHDLHMYPEPKVQFKKYKILSTDDFVFIMYKV